jgi:glycosyltransferase involved in cell wall biosynthesis
VKVAIIHDWLIAGGAEKVVLELHRMYPDAPIYTSYCTPEWRKRLEGKVRTGFLQYWPFPQLRKFVPFLRIWWFTRLKLEGYDLVISSSGAEAKGINVPKGTLHVAYIHAPTHYYWSRYEEYMKSPGFGPLDGLARLGLRLLVKPLRKWDYMAAQKPDYLIANSTHTQAGIQQYYGRDSVVVHPPVDTERFTLQNLKRTGFIALGRQTPYKRIDLAVQACTKLDIPLTVVGNGPEHHRLREMAGPTITFTGFVKDDDEVARLVASAEGFIFPGVDDFGIAPVEALACGTPVIAYKAGGALDYVNEKTGVFFDEQTVDSLVAAIRHFDTLSYSPDEIKNEAEAFSIENFHVSMRAAIDKVLQ